jgi:hypothetical protein
MGDTLIKEEERHIRYEVRRMGISIYGQTTVGR